MSTRPDPERSGAVEMATRRCHRLRVLWDLYELAHQQKPKLCRLPAGLGLVTVHSARWGVGPQQYEVHTAVVRVAIGARDYEYNHDMRTQSHRLSAD